MTVAVNETVIQLTGACGVEEVEMLLECLQAHPSLPVDLSAATAIHTALWQALMVFRPKLTEAPTSFVIAEKVMGAIDAYLLENTEL